MCLEAVPVRQRLAVIADGKRQEMILDVGPLGAGAAADEAAALEMVARAEAVAQQQPARPDQRLDKRD